MSATATVMSLSSSSPVVNKTVNSPTQMMTILTTGIKGSYDNAFSVSGAVGHTHNGVDSAFISGTAEGGFDVFNDNGSTLNIGDLFYISGLDATSGFPKVKKAISAAAGSAACLYAIGVITAAVVNQATGTGFKRARVTGLNTSGGVIGRPLWLSTTGGLFSVSLPTAGMGAQIVGTPEAIGVSSAVWFNVGSPIPWAYADQI